MYLFTMLPISVDDPSLPVIPAGEVSQLYSDLENDAFEHWVFDKSGTGNLVGGLNGTQLSIQNAAPTHQENYLTLNTASGNSIRMLEFNDSAEAQDTLCIVARTSTAGARLGGMWPKGGMYADLAGEYRAIHFLDGAPLATLRLISTTSIGGWVFMAFARDFRATVREWTAVIGSETKEASYAEGVTYTPGTFSGALMALGNANDQNGAAGTADFAEMIVYDRKLSLAELLEVKERSIARMAARGITL